MKKKILAIALTVAMLAASLSMLSLGATAEGETASEPKVYLGFRDSGGGKLSFSESATTQENFVCPKEDGMIGNREITFTVNVTDMQAVDFGGDYTSVAESQHYGETTMDTGLWFREEARDYQRLVIAPSANLSDTRAGCIIAQIVNDTTDGLVLVYTSFDGTVTPIKLGALGEDTDVKLVWNADDSGEIFVNGESRVSVEAGKMSTIQANIDGSSIPFLFGFSFHSIEGYLGIKFVNESTKAAAFAATIDGYTTTVADASAPEGGEGGDTGDSGEGEGGDTGDSGEGEGGDTGDSGETNDEVSYDGFGGNSTFAFNNSTKSAEGFVVDASGDFAGNREIAFTLNVSDMQAYDFGGDYRSVADAIQHYGETTVDTNLWATNGEAKDFQRLLIVPSANLSETRAGGIIAQLVYDATDGLVLVHTTFDGTAVPVVLGSLGEDIEVKILWNADDSGEILVNGESKATVEAGRMSTIKGEIDGETLKIPFMYGYAFHAKYGYVGMTYINESTNAAAFGATLSGYKTTVAAALAEEEDTSSTRLSYVQEGAASENVFDVRLVATVKTLDANKAGFKVSKKGASEPEADLSTGIVYKSFYQNVGGENTLVTAGEGEYFATLVIEDVGAVGAVTYTVQSYLLKDGNYEYGKTFELTYTDGVFTSCAAAE